MGQTGGSLRATTGTTIKGTYAPQGAVTDDAQRNNQIQRTGNDPAVSLLFGSGSGRIDKECTLDYAIAASSSATFDLYTGTDIPALQDEAAPLRLVKYIKVSILSGGDTSGVRIGGAASNEWTGFFVTAGDQQDIFPGGPAYQAGSPAGKSVGSTTKNLKIENLGAVEVVVRIILGGSTVSPGMWMGFWGFLTYS